MIEGMNAINVNYFQLTYKVVTLFHVKFQNSLLNNYQINLEYALDEML